MENKNPEIPQSEKVDLMSFLEDQASDLEEVENREEHEDRLRDLEREETESRREDNRKLAQLEQRLNYLST